MEVFASHKKGPVRVRSYSRKRLAERKCFRGNWSHASRESVMWRFRQHSRREIFSRPLRRAGKVSATFTPRFCCQISGRSSRLASFLKFAADFRFGVCFFFFVDFSLCLLALHLSSPFFLFSCCRNAEVSFLSRHGEENHGAVFRGFFGWWWIYSDGAREGSQNCHLDEWRGKEGRSSNVDNKIDTSSPSEKLTDFAFFCGRQNCSEGWLQQEHSPRPKMKGNAKNRNWFFDFAFLSLAFTYLWQARKYVRSRHIYATSVNDIDAFRHTGDHVSPPFTFPPACSFTWVWTYP